MFAEFAAMRVGTIAGTSAFCDSDFCTTRSGKCTALICLSLPRSHRSNRMKPRHMSRPSKRSRRDRTALRR